MHVSAYWLFVWPQAVACGCECQYCSFAPRRPPTRSAVKVEDAHALLTRRWAVAYEALGKPAKTDVGQGRGRGWGGGCEVWASRPRLTS